MFMKMRSNLTSPIKAACILDVGSNSIRAQELSIQEAGQLLRSEKRLSTTRLAAGLDKTGRLSSESMEKSVAAIRAYADEAREKGLPVFAYATSAVRDAGNQKDFLLLVEKHTGLSLDVLSGEEEARLALLGAGGDALLDIGGGSAQLVSQGFQLSFPIGCVRAKELYLPAEKEGGLSAGREAVEARCRDLLFFPRILLRNVMGVGGSITTLAALKLGLTRYDREKVSGLSMRLEDVEALIRQLYGMGDEDRALHPLLKDRHDVIIPGAILCAFILRHACIPELRISDQDGMEGYFLALCGLDTKPE